MATSRVGVGPGVKTLLQSSSRKDAIPRSGSGRRDAIAVRPAARVEPRPIERIMLKFWKHQARLWSSDAVMMM